MDGRHQEGGNHDRQATTDDGSVLQGSGASSEAFPKRLPLNPFSRIMGQRSLQTETTAADGSAPERKDEPRGDVVVSDAREAPSVTAADPSTHAVDVTSEPLSTPVTAPNVFRVRSVTQVKRGLRTSSVVVRSQLGPPQQLRSPADMEETRDKGDDHEEEKGSSRRPNKRNDSSKAKEQQLRNPTRFRTMRNDGRPLTSRDHKPAHSASTRDKRNSTVDRRDSYRSNQQTIPSTEALNRSYHRRAPYGQRVTQDHHEHSPSKRRRTEWPTGGSARSCTQHSHNRIATEESLRGGQREKKSRVEKPVHGGERVSRRSYDDTSPSEVKQRRPTEPERKRPLKLRSSHPESSALRKKITEPSAEYAVHEDTNASQASETKNETSSREAASRREPIRDEEDKTKKRTPGGDNSNVTGSTAPAAEVEHASALEKAEDTAPLGVRETSPRCAEAKDEWIPSVRVEERDPHGPAEADQIAKTFTIPEQCVGAATETPAVEAPPSTPHGKSFDSPTLSSLGSFIGASQLSQPDLPIPRREKSLRKESKTPRGRASIEVGRSHTSMEAGRDASTRGAEKVLNTIVTRQRRNYRPPARPRPTGEEETSPQSSEGSPPRTRGEPKPVPSPILERSQHRRVSPPLRLTPLLRRPKKEGPATPSPVSHHVGDRNDLDRPRGGMVACFPEDEDEVIRPRGGRGTREIRVGVYPSPRTPPTPAPEVTRLAHVNRPSPQRRSRFHHGQQHQSSSSSRDRISEEDASDRVKIRRKRLRVLSVSPPRRITESNDGRNGVQAYQRTEVGPHGRLGDARRQIYERSRTVAEGRASQHGIDESCSDEDTPRRQRRFIRDDKFSPPRRIRGDLPAGGRMYSEEILRHRFRDPRCLGQVLPWRCASMGVLSRDEYGEYVCGDDHAPPEPPPVVRRHIIHQPPCWPPPMQFSPPETLHRHGAHVEEYRQFRYESPRRQSGEERYIAMSTWKTVPSQRRSNSVHLCREMDIRGEHSDSPPPALPAGSGSRETSTSGTSAPPPPAWPPTQALPEPQGLKPNEVVPGWQIGSCQLHGEALERLKPLGQFDDSVLDFFMQFIYEYVLAEDDRECFFFMNSFFATQMMQKRTSIAQRYGSVSNWSNSLWRRRRKRVWDFDLIFVPINEANAHWYLAVIAFPWRAVSFGVSKHCITRQKAALQTLFPNENHLKKTNQEESSARKLTVPPDGSREAIMLSSDEEEPKKSKATESLPPSSPHQSSAAGRQTPANADRQAATSVQEEAILEYASPLTPTHASPRSAAGSPTAAADDGAVDNSVSDEAEPTPNIRDAMESYYCESCTSLAIAAHEKLKAQRLFPCRVDRYARERTLLTDNLAPTVLFLDSMRDMNQTSTAKLLTRYLVEYLQMEYLRRQKPTDEVAGDAGTPSLTAKDVLCIKSYTDWRISDNHSVPLQDNFYDCGLFVIEYVRKICTMSLAPLSRRDKHTLLVPRLMKLLGGSPYHHEIKEEERTSQEDEEERRCYRCGGNIRQSAGAAATVSSDEEDKVVVKKEDVVKVEIKEKMKEDVKEESEDETKQGVKESTKEVKEADETIPTPSNSTSSRSRKPPLRGRVLRGRARSEEKKEAEIMLSCSSPPMVQAQAELDVLFGRKKPPQLRYSEDLSDELTTWRKNQPKREARSLPATLSAGCPPPRPSNGISGHRSPRAAGPAGDLKGDVYGRDSYALGDGSSVSDMFLPEWTSSYDTPVAAFAFDQRHVTFRRRKMYEMLLVMADQPDWAKCPATINQLVEMFTMEPTDAELKMVEEVVEQERRDVLNSAAAYDRQASSPTENNPTAGAGGTLVSRGGQ